MAWFFLLLSMIFNSTASILVKLASNTVISSSNSFGMYFSWQFILACSLFGANLICYAQAIKNISLYIAYPFVTGCTIITLTLFSYFYSKEVLDALDITAIIVILGAIMVLSR